MHRGCTIDSLHLTPRLNQQGFYSTLAEELIDNNLKQVRTRQRAQRNNEERATALESVTDFIDLVPQLRATLKRREIGITSPRITVARVGVEFVIKEGQPLFVLFVKIIKT